MLCALIMDLRKTFTFDATHRIVRLRGRTVLKAESGEISFDDITDIGTEDTRTGRDRGAGAARSAAHLGETLPR